MGCATGCATAPKCETAETVGPVEKATVVQQVGLSGQTLLPGFRFAKATATATPGQVAFAKLAPVSYVAPLVPVATKPNPLVRPFTNP